MRQREDSVKSEVCSSPRKGQLSLLFQEVDLPRELCAPWLAFHCVSGEPQGSWLFRDEDSNIERREGDLVKGKRRRGRPWREGIRALPLLAVWPLGKSLSLSGPQFSDL